MIIKDISLLPTNLFKFRVKRQTGPPKADLITIMDGPNPVLTNYKKLCQIMKRSPFAGGNYIKQGPENIIGFITSGYRYEKGIHGYGIALDIFVWPLDKLIEWALIAIDENLFTRVGLYPDHKIIHLDMASKLWMKKHGGLRFWVCQKVIIDNKEDRKYTYFDDFSEAIEIAKGIQNGKIN